MGKLQLIKSGYYTSIQDLGRFGYRKYGVPLSGAMDQQSAKTANRLVGNIDNHPLMEMTMIGPIIQFSAPAAVAITGAFMNPRIDQLNIENDRVYHIRSGQVLSFTHASKGVRAYLAIKGLKSNLVMGSTSQYAPVTGLGRLLTGDILHFDTSMQPPIHYSHIRSKENRFDRHVLQVLPGPEFDLLKEWGSELPEKILTVKENSRMGYQLLYTNPRVHSQSILTCPVAPGTVQLTPSGQLWVLMRDAQVTGGYPRIFQLAESDIDLLSQKKSGDQVKFELIT